MKTMVKKVLVLGLGISVWLGTPSMAQDVDFTEILKAPQEDMTQYFNKYLEPGMLSFANGMAGGWYNTAETHKPFGFDLTLSVNIADVPESQYMFRFDPTEYTAIRLLDPSGNLSHTRSADVPTLVGGSTEERMGFEAGFEFTAVDPSTGNETTYRYTQDIDFEAPPGFDVSDFPLAGTPAPTIQLGLGLFKNTDLKVRYGRLPKGVIEDVSFDILGFGLMHDFKQWIPGIKHVPIDMSLFVGWSRFSSTIEINEFFPGEFEAQGETQLTADNWTVQAVVSKKIAVLTPYIGVGYTAVSSGVKVTGDYTVYQVEDIAGQPYTFTDPVDFTYDGGGSYRVTAGARLKLAIITLHADYTFQEYNMLSFGLGFTVR